MYEVLDTIPNLNFRLDLTVFEVPIIIFKLIFYWAMQVKRKRYRRQYADVIKANSPPISQTGLHQVKTTGEPKPPRIDAHTHCYYQRLDIFEASDYAVMVFF